MTRNCFNVMRKVAAAKPLASGYVPANPAKSLANNLAWMYRNPKELFDNSVAMNNRGTDNFINYLNKANNYATENAIPFIDKHGKHIANRIIPAVAISRNAYHRNNARAVEALTAAGNRAMDSYIPQAVNKIKQYGNDIVSTFDKNLSRDTLLRRQKAYEGLSRLGGRISNYFNNL